MRAEFIWIIKIATGRPGKFAKPRVHPLCLQCLVIMYVAALRPHCRAFLKFARAPSRYFYNACIWDAHIFFLLVQRNRFHILQELRHMI